MDETTWRKHTELPLLIAGFAYLVAYSWRVIAELTGPARVVATTVVLVTWGLFIIDYLVRLLMAERKGVWFRTHLDTLAFAVVPVLRLVRLLRVLTLLPGMRSTVGDRLRTDIMVYGTGAAVILIYVSSLAVLEAERNAPGANITSFGIAVWWSCVTVTTTGFGDYTPVTDAGRVVGVALMFGGVALAGVITATLASLVVDRAAKNHDDREPATRAQMRELMAKVEALTVAAARGQHPEEGGVRGPDRRDDGIEDRDSDAGPHGGGAGPRSAGGGTGLGDGGDDRPGG